jgi:plasmid stability protein
MPNLQVKDIPEKLHRQLREQARKEGRSIRDLVLDAVVRELGRREFRQKLAARQSVKLDVGASELLDEARQERQGSLER